ncbi:MAG TPA: primosomal protein N' [Actinomycetota bacterium]|nr:primosomal protein N' [Actinomycetota bacterium]
MAAWRVDRPFDYAVPDALAQSVVPGALVRVPFGARRVRAVVETVARRAPERALEAIVSVVLDVAVAPPPVARVARWVATRYCVPAARAFERVVPPRVRVVREPPLPPAPGPPPDVVRAYDGGDALTAALERGDAGLWCVQVRPGEDRGRLVAEIVGLGAARGGAALVAVPEVRHGSLVLDGVAAQHPGFARVDSAQSPSARATALVRLAAGHGVGGGGRAVVLAPSPRLRVVVVDEEHHPSFKEDRAPRYDARRVAIERARADGAACVMCSPTPSCELAGAVAAGRARVVRPARGDARAARPLVETPQPPADGALSSELHARVRDALRAGERVALLAPRRGYARTLWCAACRRSVRCPRCEAALSFDRAAARVRCPRCGHAAAPPPACPSCGAADLRYLGAGSERLAEQLRAAFPRARVAWAGPDAPDAEPGADVYVTTWAGTKEVVRPPASLVGVLDADALVRRPDFRAAETAYHALAEMAEWAGPRGRGGRLVIQTSEPAHHAVQAVARADPWFFLERELELRRELAYPPFSELVRVVVDGRDAPGWVERAADACRAAGGRVLGPVPARGGPRRLGAPSPAAPGALEILAKCPDATEAGRRLRDILASVPAGTRVTVDADPR